MRPDLVALAAKMYEEVDVMNPAEVEKFNGPGFSSTGGMYIGVRALPSEDWKVASKDHLGFGPKGIEAPDRAEFGLHVTYAGTPHHIRHWFGYWHVNDADEVFLRIPGKEPEDGATVCVFFRHPGPGERDIFSWYCEDCLTLLYAFVLPSGDLGLTSYADVAKGEDEAVRIFNSDPKLRVCPECSKEHPLAYRFPSFANSPEEEAMRAVW